MVCSDHPQSYSLPIKVFGRGRLPQPGQPGISIFDIQARIGQASPEIHAFFPRNLTIRQTVENAWADTFLGTPRLNFEKDCVVDGCLRWFEAELNPASSQEGGGATKLRSFRGHDMDWADALRFGDAPFSSQRVALFLRAIVKKPDLVILDEAFSGMDELVRDKCILFLTWGQFRYFKAVPAGGRTVRRIQPTAPQHDLIHGLTKHQALICVSHVKEEVPGLVRDWVCLPEANEGRAPRFGRLDGPLEGYENGWSEIWKS